MSGKDWASILFDLPGYRVIGAVEAAGDAPRRVWVESVRVEDGCPTCGVLSSRIAARPVQRVRDVPVGDSPLELFVRKRRFVCQQPACPRRTFTEATAQLPLRARLTSRLVARVVTDLRGEVRTVSAVAAWAGVSWRTAMGIVAGTVDLGGGTDSRDVRRLGIDEHRFRSVRFVRDPLTGTVRRLEPWSVMLTCLDTGAILDVIDGPRGPAVRSWLRARPRWWRRRVQYVAIDMSREFRAAVADVLPGARISVDHWHVARLASQMLTAVRRRRNWQLSGHRGRNTDPAWRYRSLLSRAGERLTARQRERLTQVLALDRELAAAWAIKEAVRAVTAARSRRGFTRRWRALRELVNTAGLPEAARMLRSLQAWRRELYTFCLTRISNARTEAANLTAKTFKRLARGYRNHDNYRCRIIGYTLTKTAA
jgi:transposase